MGYNYYLFRPDNSSAYELGKHVNDWRLIFGDKPTKLSATEVTYLAYLLAETFTRDSSWAPDRIEPNYFLVVAEDICDWAQGQLFEMVGESDARIEQLMDDHYSTAPVHRKRWWISGTRYLNEMDELRTLRNSAS